MSSKKRLIARLRNKVLNEVNGIQFPIRLTKTNLSTKKIPKQYEKDIREALRYFPELQKTTIEFKISDSGFFTMNALVTCKSMFMNKRKYVVLMHSKRIEKLKLLAEKTGIQSILAHELAHIVDYERTSFLGMILFLISYAFPWARKRIEVENELRTYYHGQENSMKEFKTALMKSTFLSKRYKRYHHNNYLNENDFTYLESLKK